MRDNCEMAIPSNTLGSGPCREIIRTDRFRPEFEAACDIADGIERINKQRRSEGKMELNLCTVRMFAERMLNA